MNIDCCPQLSIESDSNVNEECFGNLAAFQCNGKILIHTRLSPTANCPAIIYRFSSQSHTNIDFPES